MREKKKFPYFTLVTLALFAVVTAAIAFRGRISSALFYLTGEEEPLPQVSGAVQLCFNAVRPPLELADDVPVEHAGVNPYAVNTFLQNEVDPAKRELAMKMISDAGIKWIRQEFPWEDIEIHGKGDFEDRRHSPYRSSWDKYDSIVKLAKKYDVEIIARLSNPPSWSRAAGDDMGTFAPPDNLEDYGDFVEAVVTRYEGIIHYYQIWNEPNIYPEWGEYPVSAEEYTELLKVGYTRAKAVDPDVVIIAGALAATIELDRHPHGLTDALFLQQMYDAGAAPYFDVLSMQGYGLWSGPYDRRMQPRVLNFSRPMYIRDVMVRNGDAHKPIWLSELSWNALPPEHPSPPAYGRVTEEQQARYAVLAYRRMQEEWPWAGVGAYWFFKQADDREQESNPQYFFRMVEPGFEPMPVYYAIKEAANSTPVMYRGYHQEDHWAVRYLSPWSDESAPRDPLEDERAEETWRRVEDDRAVLGAYMRAEAPYAGLRFVFSGSSLSVVVVRQPAGGVMSVRVDGEERAVVDLRGRQFEGGVEVPVSDRLPPGEHEVELRLLADGGGSVGVMAVDGFVVRSSRPYSCSFGFARLAGWAALVGGLFAAAGIWRRRGGG